GMFALEARPPVVAHVCDDIACLTQGADKLCAELEQKLGPAGSPCSGGRATWLRSQCLGLCERAPAAAVISAGKNHGERILAPGSANAVQSLMNDAVAGKMPAEPDTLSLKASVPQAVTPQNGTGQLRLLERISHSSSGNLEDYRKLGGYEGLKKAMELGAEGVLRELSASKLLGRGGAAFPTAKKWEALFLQRNLLDKNPVRAHYLICNADESEPGTFKDRILMEGDPFAVIEGMTIGGFVTGARQGYIFLRGEYPLAAERMQHAIDSATKNGLLGENILGKGLHFNIEIRRGAGAYICGEETALFNSIEGYRGEPRNKPPFPTQAGLFRQPTAVNNVETLVNVPGIISGGGAAYAKLGTENSAGTRLFCLCGHITRPGVYEISMGATLRQLIDLAGGVTGSGKLQAVLLGGAAGAFVSPQELDTPLTFEGTRAIGATLGSGVVMLFDDTIDLRRILLRIASFFHHETCGQCVPCRVGVTRQEEALQRLVNAKPLGSNAQEVTMLREMAQAMRDASICGLGQTAASALESALHRWSLFS
ncbi:MAG TPA: NADH-ubiquinone oxidoreductase-F iron-sulfur binding region domain-containing protein, partial [Candidatus Angelobacter sp.]|nr:NADH-ubiquinone oxidoreductase-F iron-sulfur binding region domain-containing protein [Candidatus Angelobacter sp.]